MFLESICHPERVEGSPLLYVHVEKRSSRNGYIER